MFKIEKRYTLALLGISILFISAGPSGHRSAGETPKSLADRMPNIVFILADDLGWNALGCDGSKFYESPNIDRLAREGVRFTNAHACPVCSPSRAEIMTGKYSARVHVTDYISGDKPDSTKNEILNIPAWTKYLPLEEITIAEKLKTLGYRTSLFGKWHLSKKKYPPLSIPFDPDKQGFDETELTLKPDKTYPLKSWQTPEDDAHNTRHITDWGLKFLEENKDRPFFMMLSYDAVHDPVMEKKALIDHYRAKANVKDPSQSPVLAAMIKTMDDNIGRVLAKLNELHLAENTIVIFYSDNGGLAKTARQTPLRGGKANLYEGGIRVPLIVRWPGVVLPATTCDSLVGSIDFFPTFARMAGANEEPGGIDGMSFVPLLTRKGSWSRPVYYWHYPHYHSQLPGMDITRPEGAIREGNFKLIQFFEKTLAGDPDDAELYDLSKDPEEKDNLAGKMPDKAAELRTELQNWRKRVGAQMPTLK